MTSRSMIRRLSGAMLILAAVAIAVMTIAARLPARRSPSIWSRATGVSGVVHTLVVSPWGPLYAATVTGVSISDDDGHGWSSLAPIPSTVPDVWSVAAVHDPMGDRIYAASGDGHIYTLERGGARWHRGPALQGVSAAYAVFVIGRTILVGTDAGIFRSADGGSRYRRVAVSAPGAVVAFARGADGRLYAGVAGGTPTILHSADRGTTWRPASGPLPPPSVESLLAARGALFAGIMGAGGDKSVWQTERHGFSTRTRGLPADAHGMALAMIGDELLVGTMSDGVWAEQAGQAWHGVAGGPAVVTALLAPRPGTHTVLVGSGDGIWRLTQP